MKFASWLSLGCAAALAIALSAAAQDPPRKDGKDNRPEVNIVLRISRKLVNELTDRKVQRTTPVHLRVDDVEISGQAFTDAASTVHFETNPQDPAFVIELRGTAVSKTVATRPPVDVYGSGHLAFTIRKRVTFDGVKFRPHASSFDAVFRASVDGLAVPSGLLGLLVEFIAVPQIHRSQPRTVQEGYQDAKAQLIAEFDKEVNRIIDELNQVSPLEETVEKLFPETKDWIYHPIVTPTHLLVGAGPRGYRVPELPVTDKTNAPIELWIRNKPETVQMIFVLKLWRDANKQLEEMLPAQLGKKIDLKAGFRTLTVKDWFVIQLGQPAAPAPKEKEKEAPSAAAENVIWRPCAGMKEDSPAEEMVWRPVVP